MAARSNGLDLGANARWRRGLGGVSRLPDGGSAIPCGLVLPAARAKLAEGESEPEVRALASSNW